MPVEDVKNTVFMLMNENGFCEYERLQLPIWKYSCLPDNSSTFLSFHISVMFLSSNYWFSLPAQYLDTACH